MIFHQHLAFYCTLAFLYKCTRARAHIYEWEHCIKLFLSLVSALSRLTSSGFDSRSSFVIGIVKSPPMSWFCLLQSFTACNSEWIFIAQVFFLHEFQLAASNIDKCNLKKYEGQSRSVYERFTLFSDNQPLVMIGEPPNNNDKLNTASDTREPFTLESRSVRPLGTFSFFARPSGTHRKNGSSKPNRDWHSFE